MANLKDSFKEIMQTPGAIEAALVDVETGLCVAQIAGRSLDFGPLMDHYAQLLRVKERLVEKLIQDDTIEEIVFTSRLQYHRIYPLKIRVLKVREPENLFIFVALAKTDSLLVNARTKIKEIVSEFAI